MQQWGEISGWENISLFTWCVFSLSKHKVLPLGCWYHFAHIHRFPRSSWTTSCLHHSTLAKVFRTHWFWKLSMRLIWYIYGALWQVAKLNPCVSQKLPRPELRFIRITMSHSLKSAKDVASFFVRESDIPSADISPTLVYSGKQPGAECPACVEPGTRNSFGFQQWLQQLCSNLPCNYSGWR